MLSIVRSVEDLLLIGPCGVDGAKASQVRDSVDKSHVLIASGDKCWIGCSTEPMLLGVFH